MTKSNVTYHINDNSNRLYMKVWFNEFRTVYRWHYSKWMIIDTLHNVYELCGLREITEEEAFVEML